jgi:hypothetical protein
MSQPFRHPSAKVLFFLFLDKILSFLFHIFSGDKKWKKKKLIYTTCDDWLSVEKMTKQSVGTIYG